MYFYLFKMALLENLTQKDVLKALGKLLEEDSANITEALHLYVSKIRVYNPNPDEKINIHRALTMFSEYWQQHRANIININYLGNFATIFADEILFDSDYQQVCKDIKIIMWRNEQSYIRDNW
jgi:hypothetical protein